MGRLRQPHRLGTLLHTPRRALYVRSESGDWGVLVSSAAGVWSWGAGGCSEGQEWLQFESLSCEWGGVWDGGNRKVGTWSGWEPELKAASYEGDGLLWLASDDSEIRKCRCHQIMLHGVSELSTHNRKPSLIQPAMQPSTDDLYSACYASTSQTGQLQCSHAR